jgi:hypothetical protein
MAVHTHTHCTWCVCVCVCVFVCARSWGPEMASRPQFWWCRRMGITGLGGVFSVCRTHGSVRKPNRGCTICWVGSRNSFWSTTSPSTARAWKISSYNTTSAWSSKETMWKNRRTKSKTYPCAFLASSYLHPRKKIGNHILWLSLVYKTLYMNKTLWFCITWRFVAFIET